VKCTNCGNEVELRSEHCHVCGQRVVVDFDVLAQSVHEDAAVRRSEQIAGALRWVLLAMLIVGAVIYGINDLYDKPLVYDGAGLPSITAPSNVQIELSSLSEPYVEPRPNPPLPAPRKVAFGYRTSPIKERIRDGSRGNIPAEKMNRSIPTAITDGLKFLARYQMGNGAWGVGVYPNKELDQMRTRESAWGQIGVTSLALLAFLGEGETWIKDEKTNRLGMFAEPIRKGIQWVATQQDENGCFGAAFDASKTTDNRGVYNHGLATLMMCEAAGLSADESLRLIAQRGLDYIIKTQTPEGGWNYQADPKGDSDTTVSGWQIQALLAGREAGLKVPEDVLKKAAEFLNAVTTPEGRVMFSLKNDDKQEWPALYGVSLMLRQLLGEDPKSQPMRKLAEKLRDQIPQSKPAWGKNWKPSPVARNDDDARAQIDPFKLYYSTYGMYYMGGKDWDNWHEALKRTACEMQDTTIASGAWILNDGWSQCAGDVYSTALMIMSMQVYYRIQ
jgi:hypothetical protein